MSVARKYHQTMIHYLRADIGFADNGAMKVLGTIPAGSFIVKPISGVNVATVFNAGTTNTLNIGTPANDDLYGTLLALGSLAFVPVDEAVTQYVAVDTVITATVVLTGTAATTGAGQVLIAYIPPDEPV